MKTKIILTTLAIGLATIDSHLSTVHAQGALTPPGAPAPTMKSLDQVEARTPISSAPFNINKPGSYYLTTNLTVTSGNAITIASTNVTLDLNGFALISTDASPSDFGILLNSGMNNIGIKNGCITGGATNNSSGVSGGPGFLHGISAGASKNIRVTQVNVAKCKSAGINLSFDSSSVVESCQVNTIGGTGITADVITDSTAFDCGNIGISGGTINNSRGEAVGAGTGIDGETVNNCQGNSSTGIGINATVVSGSYGNGGAGTGIKTYVANNSRGNSNGAGNGIEATESATGCGAFSFSGIALMATVAINCTASQSGGTAIKATVANGCYATAGTNLITYKYNMP